MDRKDIKMLVKKWFDIYDDESLDYKSEVENREKFSSYKAAVTEAGVVRYVTAPSTA